MTDEDDLDLSADLAHAFLRPAAPERPELAAAIMGRVRRADRRRRRVLAGAGLTGAAVAAAAVTVAGAFDPFSLHTVVILASSEAALMALGLTLIVLAVGRHVWSDV